MKAIIARSILVSICCACFPLTHHGRVAAQSKSTVSVHVDTMKKAGFKIPRTIFGSFLEPIGNSTYNGLWAELLQNPSLEENLWSARAVGRMVAEQPSLEKASQLGLPLPWEPLKEKQGNRYEARWNDAANSWRSLAIYGLPDEPVGIRQQVYLPVHRELNYHGSLYAKHISGSSTLHISVRGRNHPEQIFGQAQVAAPKAEWQKLTFRLTVQEGQIHPLEASDFVVALDGDEQVQLDQLSLVPDDAVNGMDPDMIRMARDMKTSVVRFGGNFTSAYHWKDGIGPADKRINMSNIAWGIPEYNQFGTDEFLQFCRLIDAQPQIALNLGSGTPEEAAGWVQYVNEHWKPSQGSLWELGNELWGNWNLGSPTLGQLADRTHAFSQAIRKVDPSARLIATGQDPDVYEKWNAQQLTLPPRSFDFLSTHFVVTTDRTVGKEPSLDQTAADAFAMPVALGRKLRDMQKQISGKYGKEADPHLAFTEWLWVGGNRDAQAETPRYDNMGGALITGGFFNMLMNNADVVPISDMTGIIEFQGIWKKQSRVYGAPPYYVFQLYATADADTPVSVQNDAGTYDVHEGVTRVPEIKKVPYLDITAALNSSGTKLTLFCVNRHLTRDFDASLDLGSFTARGEATIKTLHASSIYDTNNELHPKAVTTVQTKMRVNGHQLPYVFPHESVTTIEFEGK